MTTYTMIFFYSDGSTNTYEAGSTTSATAIEAGVLSVWYTTAMTVPVIAKNRYLTGMVIIDNRYLTVIENKTYVTKGDTI